MFFDLRVLVLSHQNNTPCNMCKCHCCGLVVPAGMPAFKIVLEQREQCYPHRAKVFAPKGLSPKKRKQQIKAKKFDDWLDDPGGLGWETVREVVACAVCWQQRNDLK